MRATVFTLALMSALSLGVATASAADKAPGVKVGTLTCTSTSIDNLVLYAEHRMTCDFDGVAGRTETYSGKIERVGLDLTLTEKFTMIWAVFAPTDAHGKAGLLKGSYVGGGTYVAVVGGVGTKLLVGGAENVVSLQPVSVSGIEGVGAAVGVERFVLN